MIDKLNEKIHLLESDNLLLTQKLKDKNKEIQQLKRQLNKTKSENNKSDVIDGQTNMFDYLK